MVCGGRFLYYLLISLAVALITYNAIISSTATLLAPGFPGRRGGPYSRSASSDRVENRRWLFHTAVTSSDSAYNAWQCRVMYYWFKKAREARPDVEMGGFTRILHSGRADNLMDEIPTFVADPLPNGMDQGYIFMAEPDHIIVKPIPNLAKFGSAAAFPFFYIEPKKYEPVLRNFYPEDEGPITNIDPIGNSPVIIDKASLKKIAPTWMNISLEMKKNPKADKAFGWVLEMYAYAVASALHGVGNILHKDLMIQPPWDLEVGDKYIIHYTYGCDYNMKGELTYGKIGEWRFDKRSYTSKPPPRNLPLPPAGVAQSVVTLVKMLNEATANIPNWDIS